MLNVDNKIEKKQRFFKKVEKKRKKDKKTGENKVKGGFVIDYLPREMAALPISWGELMTIFKGFFDQKR